MCDNCHSTAEGTGCAGTRCLSRAVRQPTKVSQPIHPHPQSIMKAKPTQRPGEVVLEINRSDEAMLAAANVHAGPPAFRIHRILVPVDFSDCAKKALQYAIPLAQEHEAALTLLYIVPPIYTVGEYGGIEYPQLQAEMQASGIKALEKLRDAEVRDQVPTEMVVRLGAPANEIIEAARELNSDLIVVSTHGRTGLKHLLLGSVAEHVVRRAPCPVLIVREREHEILAR